MRLTAPDALAMALGAVAVVFSGFVLAHSAWGGVALLFGGAIALSIAPLRGRVPAAAPAVWLVFVLLLATGVAGFLLGFGVFDAPALDHDAEATLHDAGTGNATVVVTGTVRNVGDGPAAVVAIDVALLDDAGDTLRSDSVRMRGLGAAGSQQFFVRFGPAAELSAFEAANVEVETGSEYGRNRT